MDIKGLVASYQTFYGGEPNRIHNVQLVSHLVDKHVIAPGETFSFNGATGARTEDKGFLEAPVIINGELTDGPRRRRLPGLDDRLQRCLRGRAPDRLAHEPRALHQPLPPGTRRDRQLSRHRPEVHQRHGHWLLLRTWVGSSSLTVALYGTPVHRRVVSETSPLVVTGPPPVKRINDPSLFVGQTVVEESGSSLPQDEQRAQGLRRRREAALRHDVLLVVPRRDRGHPRRHEASARRTRPPRQRRARRRRPPRPPRRLRRRLGPSDRVREPAGSRVGRSVFASTQAWDVHPSAITSPSRVIS